MSEPATHVTVLPRPTLGARVSSAYDWTICIALVALFLAQAFLPEKIGWIGTTLGVAVALLAAHRLHSHRHRIERLRQEQQRAG